MCPSGFLNISSFICNRIHFIWLVHSVQKIVEKISWYFTDDLKIEHSSLIVSFCPQLELWVDRDLQKTDISWIWTKMSSVFKIESKITFNNSGSKRRSIRFILEFSSKVLNCISFVIFIGERIQFDNQFIPGKTRNKRANVNCH